jgi:octaheme c-type cytochrome (tetrathionate reductase family)
MMKLITAILALAASLLVAATPAVSSEAPAAAAKTEVKAEKPVFVKPKTTSTADHTKFKELQQGFASGPEVTKACLKCHNEAATQVMHTKHWSWEYLNPQTNQKLGKKHVINNFCTAVESNQAFCTACHVGYGWKDNKFDFAKQDNVDCLVCHDTTGSYRKLPGLAGHPPYKDTEYPPKSGKIVPATDLKFVAQNVGKTSRATCGACHFYGGGGDAVKHGDLDSSLKQPSKYLDVHMAKDGLNFTCSECHKTSSHEVPGSRYAVTANDTKKHIRGKTDGNPATCQSCHTTAPHKTNARLNGHSNKIACQTCHIPEFARAQPTKMSWDWSTAGKRDADGKHLKIKDSTGHHDAYDSRKGDFTYESNVIPQYVWFNGKVNYTLRDTKLDPTKVIKINSFEGSADDGKSKIWPIKRFVGKQPYDVGTNQLVIFQAYGTPDNKDAYWVNLDWEKALERGAKESGIPYSGKHAFVETEMSWPITHMVAPKGDALTCAQCHQPQTGVGRLDKVEGIYMPGRRANYWLDLIGWSIAGLTLLGMLAHGAGRIYVARKSAAKTH